MKKGEKTSVLKQMHTQRNNYLIMMNVNEKDSGRYICYGTYTEAKVPFNDYADVFIGGSKLWLYILMLDIFSCT